MGLAVKFWGVRGSFPCTDAQYLRYGGNTPCLEIILDDKIVVIDAGTGCRQLGQYLHGRPSRHIPLLFSHLHFDHLIGLPFFAPLYNHENSIKIYSACASFGYGSIQSSLSKMIVPPFFPISWGDMPAKKQYVDFNPGDKLALFPDAPDIRVRTVSIEHPNGCVGYRFDFHGKSLGILCDFMHSTPVNKAAVDLMLDVDMLVFDAAFTPEQYENKKTWGHSSWEHALEWRKLTSCGTVLLTHHDIVNDDNELDNIVRTIAERDPHAHMVKEGELWQVK